MNLFGERELALLNLADENLRLVRFAFGGLALFGAFVAFTRAARLKPHGTVYGTGGGGRIFLYSNVAAALACIPLLGGIIFVRTRHAFVRFNAIQSLIFGGAWFLFNIVSAALHAVFGGIPGIGGILAFSWAIVAALIQYVFLTVMIITIVKAFSGVYWEIPYLGLIASKTLHGANRFDGRVLAAAGLIIGAAAGWYLAGHQPVAPDIAAPMPSDADKRQEEPLAAQPAQGDPDAEAVARLKRQELLKAAIEQADKYEAAQEWPQAIAAFARVQKAFPESEDGRGRLERLLEKIQSEPDALREQGFDALRDALTEAATLDAVRAMEMLGDLLRERDPKGSFNWLWAAADRGSVPSISKVGLYFSNGKGVARDFVKAAQCFELARQAGDVSAGTLLAECYLFGKGVRKNEAKAVNLLKNAAAANDPRAMDQLGNCYHKGIGVARDDRAAFELFKAAADRKYLDSFGNLGVIYLTSRDPALGRNEALRTQTAVELFRYGAKQNNALCMYFYAGCFEKGVGVKRNPSEARDWYRWAAEAGNPAAQEWCRQHNVELATDQAP